MNNRENKIPDETIEKKKPDNIGTLLITLKVMLAIFLVIIVSGLAVLHFWPDSSLALVIDGFIMQLTSPDTNKSDEPEEVEETAPSDKDIHPIDEEIPVTEKAVSDEEPESATVIDSNLCGEAFAIVGRTFGALNEEIGPFTKAFSHNGGLYYKTEGKTGWAGFAAYEINNAGDEKDEVPCISCWGNASDVFNVADEIPAQDLAEIMGVDFDEDSFFEYPEEYEGKLCQWTLICNDKNYTALLICNETLNVQSVILFSNND